VGGVKGKRNAQPREEKGGERGKKRGERKNQRKERERTLFSHAAVEKAPASAAGPN
jgi:hypothetical protein